MYDSVEPVAKRSFKKTFKRNIQQGTIEKAKNYVVVWIKLPIFRSYGEEKVLHKSKERDHSLEKIRLSMCTKLLLHEYYAIQRRNSYWINAVYSETIPNNRCFS